MKTNRMARQSPVLLALAISASGMMALPTAVAAAETADPLEEVLVWGRKDSPYTVESSSAATRLSLSLRDTPQSITVFTRDRMDDQQLLSLRDVLDQTPGVYSYAWDTERVLFTARGFTIDNLLYDGVPAITNFSTDSVDDTLDVAVYERIEIVRGATGLVSGAGSPAASINLVRKRATSRSLKAQVEATTGSWNDRRVETDVSTPLNTSGSVRARFVGVYQDRNSYQDLYENEKTVFYGIVEADVTPLTKASLGFDYQDNNPRGNTWGSFPLFLADGSEADWDTDVTTATNWSFWDRRTKSVFGEVEQLLPHDWLVRATLTQRKFDENLALFYMYGFPDPVTGEGLDPYAQRSKGDIDDTSWDVFARGPFELLGRTHEMVVGYFGSQTQNDGVEFQPGEYADPGNFFEWDGSYPSPGFAAEATLVSDIKTRQSGTYTALRLELADALKLVTGARYTVYDADIFYLYESPEASPEYDYEKLVPYAGLIYDISTNYSGFVSYTEIFKPQNSRDENGSYLDPIEGESLEAGIRGEHFGNRLFSALTVFDTQQDNVATAVYDPETGEPILLPDGTQVSRPIEGTRTRGVELEISGELRENWNGSLGWTRYSMEDENGDDVRTFVPRSLVRMFTTWIPPIAAGRLLVGGGVDWQSSSETFVGSPDGGTTFHQDDVTLVGLMARYQFNANLALQFNANNLFDKTYYVLDEYDNTYFGEPRNAYATLSYNF